MWANTEEAVDARIRAAIDDLGIYDNHLRPGRYSACDLSNSYPLKVGIVSAFYTLLQRHQELLDHLGLEYKYDPPKSEKYTLIKKGKSCPSSK